MQLPLHYQIVVNRLVDACQPDERIVAAFLSGSYARGTADAYSDLDLYVITTDEAYNDFLAQRAAFVHLLGEPLFLEDFALPDAVFFIFSYGVEGELGIGRTGDFRQLHSGPFDILIDKQGLLADVVLSDLQPDHDTQVETLRRQLLWFWHDLSHFITSTGRGQLWWARGQLEQLRRYCVNLARLRHNFMDGDVGEECYFKIDRALPAELLSVLQATFCPLEERAMLRAALVILRFYQELAHDLVRTHQVIYPVELERLMSDRLETLCEARLH